MAPKPKVRGAKKKAKPPEVDCFAPLAMTTLPFPAYCCKDIKPADESVPDNLRHPCRRRRVAAALGADDAVDDGHADAGEIAELDAGAGRRVGAENDAAEIAHLARGSQRKQRRALIAVVNQFEAALAAFADTADLVIGQGGMAAIDVADHVGVSLQHHVLVDQAGAGN